MSSMMRRYPVRTRSKHARASRHSLTASRATACERSSLRMPAASRASAAVDAFAKRAGFQIVDAFRDEAVSGKDPIDGRPGFSALLERIVGNGVRVVIVEDASRFARHLMTQESGIALLVGLGVRVLTANGDDLTDSDDEFRIAMRQIMGVFSQLERIGW